MNVEILEGVDAIQQLKTEWVALLSAERWSFFGHPDWYLSIWKSYYQKSKVFILVVRTNGIIVGILPFCCGKMNKYGLFLPVGEVLGGRRSDYWMPVVKPGYEKDVFPRFLEAILSIKNRGGVIILPNMPEVNWVQETINDFLTEHSLNYVVEETTCPWFSFESSYEKMEIRWSKKHRQDLRRLGNKVANDFGEVSLKVIKDKDEALGYLPVFFEMHDKAWLARGVPGTFDDKCERDKYKIIVENLWGQHVHFSLLLLGDKIAAFHFGFLWKGALLLYKPTYDVDMYMYSPGKLIVQYLIMEGIQEQWKVFDFLQGAEQYKFYWTNNVTSTKSYIIKTKCFSPSFYWLSKGRAYVESKIGNTYLKIRAFFQERSYGKKYS